MTGTVCYVDETGPEAKTVPKLKLELWKSAWCDAAWLSSCFVITQSQTHNELQEKVEACAPLEDDSLLGALRLRLLGEKELV